MYLAVAVHKGKQSFCTEALLASSPRRSLSEVAVYSLSGQFQSAGAHVEQRHLLSFCRQSGVESASSAALCQNIGPIKMQRHMSSHGGVSHVLLNTEDL